MGPMDSDESGSQHYQLEAPEGECCLVVLASEGHQEWTMGPGPGEGETSSKLIQLIQLKWHLGVSCAISLHA